MKITLYSTGCPQCKVLKMKLEQTKQEFEVITDQDKMIELGFKSAPILQVDDKFYTFQEAIAWIREQQHGS